MPSLQRPNILLVLFDALSGAASGTLLDAGQLPVGAKLAERSAVFNRAYAPNPQSSPARASVFTGLDPSAHGLWANGVALPAHERTFPESMRLAGYSTWLAGRRQLAGVSNWTTEHVRAGEYERLAWAHGPLHRSRQNAYLVWLQQHAPERYAVIFPRQADPDNTNIGEEQRDLMNDLPDDLSFNHWVGQCIGNWVTEHPRQQAFLAVAGFCVGSAMGADSVDGNESSLDSAVVQADVAIGHILDAIANSHRADDTVVLVTAARGDAFTRSSANSLHEDTIRVPLQIYRPGHPAQTIAGPVSTMDIAPTVLDLAKVPIGHRMQGRSLVSVLEGSDTPRAWAMSRLRTIKPDQTRNWRTSFCVDNLKLVVTHGITGSASPATYQLFDLAADPGELNNLSDDPAHAADLEHMIDQMIDARCALEDRTEPRVAKF